jgi:hypothetical protein
MRTRQFSEVLHRRGRGPRDPGDCDTGAPGGAAEYEPVDVTLDHSDHPLRGGAVPGLIDFWGDVVVQTDEFVRSARGRARHDGGDEFDERRGAHGGVDDMLRELGALLREVRKGVPRVFESASVSSVPASDQGRSDERANHCSSRIWQVMLERRLERPRCDSAGGASAERLHEGSSEPSASRASNRATQIDFVRGELLLMERLVFDGRVCFKRVCRQSFVGEPVCRYIEMGGAL